jgi:hypothetical protein
MARKRRQQQQRRAAGGKVHKADDGSWMKYLTKDERRRAMAARVAVNEYRTLGLNRKASRDAWLAEDPDAVVERQRKYEKLLLRVDEYGRLSATAKYRRAKQMALKGATSVQEPRAQQIPKEQGDEVAQEGRQDSVGDSDNKGANEAMQNRGKPNLSLFGCMRRSR